MKILFALLAIIASVTLVVWASVPQQINYQGYLTRTNGSALDTTVAMSFKLYSDSSGATLLWTESRPTVAVARGLFNVRLGQVTTLNDAILNQSEIWLGITVGNNSEMTPRTRIVSTPYSYRVGTVDGATGGTITSDVSIDGKANIGTGNSNAGILAFVNGESNSTSGDYSVISGGYGNTASQTYATISGGNQNTASQQDATISGGSANNASGQYATVGGGGSNVASGNGSNVGGGAANQANDSYAVVSGGQQNTSAGYAAFVGGGYGNNASNDMATVGGGETNTASGAHSTVSGGAYNAARAAFSTVAGGGGVGLADSNSASGEYSAVGGGNANYASGFIATISGGSRNMATGLRSAIGGGGSNHAGGDYSVVGGGGGASLADSNWANFDHATISGGRANGVISMFGTIGGGDANIAADFAAVGGGDNNAAYGYASAVNGGQGNNASGNFSSIGGGFSNDAGGIYSCVPGGYRNGAYGDYSFAGGLNSRADHDGAFVWGVSSFGDTTHSFAARSVTFRCEGGARFYSTGLGTGTGVQLAPGGGSWSSLSDSTQKENRKDVNTSEVLRKLNAMKISEWNYKSQDDKIRHMGPMAQDFSTAFGLGENNTSITTIDADGVMMAAIQELAKQNLKQDEEIRELRAQVQSFLANQKQTMNTR